MTVTSKPGTSNPGTTKTATTKTATTKTRQKKSTTVDPRIEARRTEVKQEAGRRRLRTFGLLVALTLVVLAVLYVMDSPASDVDEFQVVGSLNADPMAIIGATGIVRGDALLELDVDGAARGVEGLSWVDQAFVERNWRGTVTITVTERVPVAAVATDQAVVAAGGSPFMLIDRGGRQLAPADVRPDGFMPIAGVSASGIVGNPAPTEVQSVLDLIEAMTPTVASAITQVSLEGKDLFLSLTTGGQVRLGADSGLDEKLIGLETMLSRVDLRCLHEIDLRVATAPAVTRVSADGRVGAAISDLGTCT